MEKNIKNLPRKDQIEEVIRLKSQEFEGNLKNLHKVLIKDFFD
jgi:hypothetical protein